MSLDATRWAWSQDLKPSAKLLLLSLADRCDENACCWPSTARLVKDTSLNQKTVFKVTSDLEKNGLIGVTRVMGRGNLYHLFISTSTKNNTSTDIGTTPENNTSTDIGTTTTPKNGTTPVPKTGVHQYQKRYIEPINNLPMNLPIESINTPEKDFDKKNVNEVVDLYHKILPTLPRVIKITDSRKKRVLKLLSSDLPTIKSWSLFFDQVSNSDFLMGRSGKWSCDFEWLIKPENALKVAEGRYSNKTSSDTGALDWMEGLNDDNSPAGWMI